MSQTHVFSHEVEGLSVLDHCVLDGVDLVGHHGHDLSCQPVDLIEAYPTASITQARQQFLQGADVDLTRAIEDDTVLSHASSQLLQTLRFPSP